ncbi:hypothetical protein CBR_g18723 [Chara braunii]|uniref:EF-hand domain-containing protein n=1 Tax=Chara braunii TaxID=69332 RepID=A0A388KWF2_CHABU|nr:hypothetical protein CBR_g18723 [Chara braunii]|eukprot:GBG74312.1 hypothetical protein CBR_g18723 [Chara braunii]
MRAPTWQDAQTWKDGVLHRKMLLRFFWRLVRDCRMLCRALPLADIDHLASTSTWDEEFAKAMLLDPHNGAVSTVSYYEFIECLIRCAWALHPNLSSMSERFTTIMAQNIQPHARHDSRDSIQKEISVARGGADIEAHRPKLMKIYKFFCKFAQVDAAKSEDGIALDTATQASSRKSLTSSLHGGKKIPEASRVPVRPSGDGTKTPADSTEIQATLQRKGPQENAAANADVRPKSFRQDTSRSPSICEGNIWMCFNDLLRMLSRLDLYSPQLTPQKVLTLTTITTGDKDLMPHEHPHNYKSKIIFEEFVEILARIGVVILSAKHRVPAYALLKGPNGAWRTFDSFLEKIFYPAVKRTFPARL